MRRGIKKQRDTLISEKPTHEELSYVYHTILNQKKFLKYDCCHALSFFARCLCKRNSKLNPNAKNDLLINKGQKKLLRDLDVSELLLIIRGFRVLEKALFKKEERMLLKFQRANTILSASDSEI